jgi:DNA-binding GntR family transcriptional regulator
MLRVDMQSRSSSDDRKKQEVATMGQTAAPPPQGAATTDATHRWQSIRDEIIAEIIAGTYPPGSLLPSNAQIQQRWKVSSTTSRKVLAELADAGWARSQGTRGYIATPGPHPEQARIGDAVREANPPTVIDQPAASQQEPAPPQAAHAPFPLPRPQHTVPLAGTIAPTLTTITGRSVQPEPAPAEVAHALQLPAPGAPVLVRRHVIADSTGTVPVELWTAYLDSDHAGDGPLAQPEPLPGTWPQALTTYTGHTVTTGTSHISARRPDPYEAHALNLTTADIVLARATTLYAEGGPVSYAVSVWPGTSTHLSAEDHSVT